MGIVRSKYYGIIRGVTVGISFFLQIGLMIFLAMYLMRYSIIAYFIFEIVSVITVFALVNELDCHHTRAAGVGSFFVFYVGAQARQFQLFQAVA